MGEQEKHLSKDGWEFTHLTVKHQTPTLNTQRTLCDIDLQVTNNNNKIIETPQIKHSCINTSKAVQNKLEKLQKYNRRNQRKCR